MMEENCKCFHHGLVKALVVLAWLSAIGFWWASAFKQSFFWMDADHFFKDAVVIGLLILLSKYCGCCGMRNDMCGHSGDCKCGDCGRCK